MATTVETTFTYDTLADVDAAAQSVPLQRIRMHPLPGTATEEDVLRVHAKEKRLCELIDGILVEKAVGAYESYLAIRLGELLSAFVRQQDLGVILGEGGMMRLAPGLVRIPDLTFIGWDQLPGRVFPRRPIPDLHPDLAIEVLSESNTATEMQRKLQDYFAAGAQQVWYLEPRRQEMQVYTAVDAYHVVSSDGMLDGGEVLPGFATPLSTIFDVPLSAE